MWTEWKVHSVLTAQSSHFVFTTFWPSQKESFPSLGIACLFFIEQILVYWVKSPVVLISREKAKVRVVSLSHFFSLTSTPETKSVLVDRKS